MRKEVTLFVLVLLLLSIFSIAEESDTNSEVNTKTNIITQPTSEPQTTSEAEDCGFWCKVSEFLFGSAENRAGKGWFDRKEALVD